MNRAFIEQIDHAQRCGLSLGGLVVVRSDIAFPLLTPQASIELKQHEFGGLGRTGQQG